MMDLSKENSRRAEESRNYFRLTLDSVNTILMEGSGTGNTLIWYNSVSKLMSKLHEDIISRTQDEADNANLSDGANSGHSFTVMIMKSEDVKDPKNPFSQKDPSAMKRSISCYVSAVADIENRDDLELLVILRLSDHNREVDPIMIKLDINKWIRIKGKDGKLHKWLDLDWRTQKIDLINGKEIDVFPGTPGSPKITGAQFSIAPDAWKEIVRKGQKIIMDQIHEFANDHNSKSWSSN